jgi:hypothetical protein
VHTVGKLGKERSSKPVRGSGGFSSLPVSCSPCGTTYSDVSMGLRTSTYALRASLSISSVSVTYVYIDSYIVVRTRPATAE